MEDRGKELREILKSKIIPLNRLMIETDAPFMTPHNMPKRVNRNVRYGFILITKEPAFLRYVLETVADCYGESLEKVAEETTKTTMKFFAL